MVKWVLYKNYIAEIVGAVTGKGENVKLFFIDFNYRLSFYF